MCQYLQINLHEVCASMYQNFCFTHLHQQDSSGSLTFVTVTGKKSAISSWPSFVFSSELGQIE